MVDIAEICCHQKSLHCLVVVVGTAVIVATAVVAVAIVVVESD